MPRRTGRPRPLPGVHPAGHVDDIGPARPGVRNPAAADGSAAEMAHDQSAAGPRQLAGPCRERRHRHAAPHPGARTTANSFSSRTSTSNGRSGSSRSRRSASATSIAGIGGPAFIVSSRRSRWAARGRSGAASRASIAARSPATSSSTPVIDPCRAGSQTIACAFRFRRHAGRVAAERVDVRGGDLDQALDQGRVRRGRPCPSRPAPRPRAPRKSRRPRRRSARHGPLGDARVDRQGSVGLGPAVDLARPGVRSCQLDSGRRPEPGVELVPGRDVRLAELQHSQTWRPATRAGKSMRPLSMSRNVMPRPSIRATAAAIWSTMPCIRSRMSAAPRPGRASAGSLPAPPAGWCAASVRSRSRMSSARWSASVASNGATSIGRLVGGVDIEEAWSCGGDSSPTREGWPPDAP